MLGSHDFQTGRSAMNQGKKKNSEFTKIPTPQEVIHCEDRRELRTLAKQEEVNTEYGSAAYFTRFKARSAAFTRNTVNHQVTKEDREVITEIQEYLKGQTVIEIDRQMCQGPIERAFSCRLWVTKPYARLAHMFHASLGVQEGKKKQPDLFVVDVPEFPGERRILVDPNAGVTYVLGTDYYGEIKKAFLRMVMYQGKMDKGLGLHAGSKEVWARNEKTDELSRSGMLFFGLSGTGKTSLTCHDFNLNENQGEKCRVRQDDVVIFKADGSARGTEIEGFYIKTEDLNPTDQKALFKAATSQETIFENVFVDPSTGKVDFYNTLSSKNARAVVPVRKVLNTDGDIDMPLANKIFFITRNPLIPPIARLSREQAAVAFMLGESIKTSAADPSAKGEAVREVGTNPFIVGSEDEEGNRFYEILEGNPDIECFLLNTGKVGEGDQARKIEILDTVAILRAVARDSIVWRKDELLRFEIPEKVAGVRIEDFSFKKIWKEPDLEKRLAALRLERRAWLDRFPKFHQTLTSSIY